jgi:hypothetical protein
VHQRTQCLSPLFVIFAVSVAFYLQTRSPPSQWYIDCNLAKEECELVLSEEVCTTKEPGQAMGSTRLETPTMAEVHEAK